MNERYYEPGYSQPNVARDEAYDAGIDAYETGESKDACPYNDPRLAMDWSDGWSTAQMNAIDNRIEAFRHESL